MSIFLVGEVKLGLTGEPLTLSVRRQELQAERSFLGQTEV